MYCMFCYSKTQRTEEQENGFQTQVKTFEPESNTFVRRVVDRF